MTRQELIEHVEAELEEFASDYSISSSKAQKHLISNRAKALIDMLGGFDLIKFNDDMTEVEEWVDELDD